MSVPACIANAIADALGVQDVELPATPRRIHALIAGSEASPPRPRRVGARDHAMKPRPFDYARPDTVEEAVAILAEHGDEARVLAGGQTLLAMLNLRVVEPAILVDITRIPELDAIRELDGAIEVGAAVTQSRLLAWPALAQKLPSAGGGLAVRRPFPDPQQGHGLRLHSRMPIRPRKSRCRSRYSRAWWCCARAGAPACFPPPSSSWACSPPRARVTS
jgi:hypothetical protein